MNKNKQQLSYWLWLLTVAVMFASALSLSGNQLNKQLENYGQIITPSIGRREVSVSSTIRLGATAAGPQAKITAYSKYETCPERECITASGTTAKSGRTIACPRSVSFGTEVEINNHVYTCEDRTALWVEKYYGPRYDIFMDSYQEALDWGMRNLVINIK